MSYSYMQKRVIMFDEQKILARFLELVKTDSPSGSEGAVREKLIAEFCKLGCSYDVDKKGNLKIELPGTIDAPVRLFSAHMDTVEPGWGVKPRVNGRGVITSDGTTILGADDKDGITAIWCALDKVISNNIPHPPIEILFSVCEEANLGGAKQFEGTWIKSRVGWVFDGSGKLGAYYRNGVGKTGYRFEITGRAAHSGICPEKGLNALIAASDAMLSFQPGHVDGATVNYGTVKGGTADNIVPEKVVVTGEIRAQETSLRRRIETELENSWRRTIGKHSCTLDIIHSDGYPAFSLPPCSPHQKLTETVLRSCGLDPELLEFKAGCDANYLSVFGIDVCIIATGRTGNHTTGESTTVSNLNALTDIAYALMIFLIKK